MPAYLSWATSSSRSAAARNTHCTCTAHWGRSRTRSRRLLPSVIALGPDATQAVFSNRNKDFSQKGWHPVIGPFFKRGLMLLDFDEHMHHRRILQEAFTRSRLAGYVEHIDRVASQVVGNEWVANDPRFLFHPAAKELTLDIASMVFMGHEPGTDHDLVTKVNHSFTTTTRAGGAIIRTGVPPFKWWRGLQARKVLEDYFSARVKERRNATGTDMLTVLCHTEDEDGNSFTDEDIVNHMIFVMMAAHDTSTSTLTTMAYQLAAHPEWQDRVRDESDRLGDGPLDIEALDKLETLDLVMNESLRMVTPLHLNVRSTVRDTDLLGYYIPAGTSVITWPSMNHRLPELWTDPDKFDPGAVRRAPLRTQEASLRFRPVRRRCTQVHRHGVRAVGGQDGDAPTAASLPARAAAPRVQAALRLRGYADPDGRHADRAASAALTPIRARVSSRLAHAITARNADCVGSSDHPIAHSMRAPS